MKKFLLSEGDRNELRRLLSAARSAPAPTVLRDVSRKAFIEGDTYWALPPCETGLPAAEFVGDKWTSYGIKCCLFKKDSFTNKMEPLLDVVGNPIRAEVWNHYGTSEMNLVQVHKHKEGFWTNERPLGATANTAVNQSTTSGPIIPQCAGKCVWTADANGVWQWPTGDCAASSTTSTTTGSPTTGAPGAGSTAPPLGIPTTPSPCIAAPPCYLVCVDTSTTPAPDEYGVPVPYVRFRYEMKVGSSCPAGCKCYGLGDPCFLVAGELKSTCIGDTAATSTTTATPGSTPPPEAYPCEEAEFIFGTVPPNIRRISYKINGDTEPCQECSDPKADFYSPGAVPYRQHDWRKLSTVYESACIDSPCTFAPDSEGLPLFTAFRYTDQVNLWGVTNNPALYDNTPGLPAPRYLANWFNCETTLRNRRPSRTPPLWIYDVDDALSTLNTARGITFVNGVYVFRTIWAEGLACGNCGRGPTLLERDRIDIGPGGSTTSTTTSTSTTGPPCGCVRPDYCPLPFECTLTACIKGGEVVDGVPGTTKPPMLDCFIDSSTSTTNGPNQCIDSRGRRCACSTSSTTTEIPVLDPRCPAGFTYEAIDFCTPGTCVPTSPRPPADPAVKCWQTGCTGRCRWLSIDIRSLAGGDAAEGSNLVWIRGEDYVGEACCAEYACDNGFRASCTGFFSGSGEFSGADIITNCSCVEPAEPPTACGLVTFTGCRGSGYRECDCCYPTTAAPCDQRVCRYRANAALRWVIAVNNCITGCPCPDPAGLPRPIQECESFSITCGSVLPPTSTSPPTSTTGTTTTGTSTTSTTTPSPFGCCQNPGGSCFSSREVDCRTGGRVWSGPPNVCTWTGTGSACLPPTTTPPTTTPAPTTTPGATTTPAPTTTPTPDPCETCPYTDCGCASAGQATPLCPPGATFSCALCFCVAATTTPAPTTTGAPPATTTID